MYNTITSLNATILFVSISVAKRPYLKEVVVIFVDIRLLTTLRVHRDNDAVEIKNDANQHQIMTPK